jgi:hypothetical protein
MATFREYIASDGVGVDISEKELDALLQRYEWFTVARTIQTKVAGKRPGEDAHLRTLLADRVFQQVVAPLSIDKQQLRVVSSEDIIDKFLHHGDYRIVAEEGDVESDIKTSAELTDEDDLVTEELAEIYRQQGLIGEACAIYRKLSLQNPEKSVYFAKIIDEMSGKGIESLKNK